MTRVLVVGATGTTGSEVVRQLRGRATVRAVSRSADAAERFRRDGVEGVVADLADATSLTAALEDVDAVYVASSPGPDLPALEGTLAEAAAAAGVDHLVKLSVIGAAADSPLTFARLHHDAEQRIQASGVDWTMVRPNGFMQNTLAWVPQLGSGRVALPIPDARWSIVDVRDVAAVAVEALLEPERHRGRAHTVTGPVASSPREQVRIVAGVTGRPLEVAEISIEASLDALRGAGVPAWTAERLGELFRFYADGAATEVAPDVRDVLGRPAHDYARFAADHAAAFGAG